MDSGQWTTLAGGKSTGALQSKRILVASSSPSGGAIRCTSEGTASVDDVATPPRATQHRRVVGFCEVVGGGCEGVVWFRRSVGWFYA